ncbi:type II toxin-antitoxin system MqsR family toxin [Cupriavidus sp. UYPR2.512]|uniref:type II toxin-antitoxin system MqsR family toxin n=1 Tax=Cupriavidus sp. UYPR2.512 TaxID=1080187 RepID=UPI00037790CA|nr:type II toxin-antitoxin system MqsR family toxin [Cupriavidus sp. UYPR2.512]UIF86455.1 type II toxin-antitoxin system MqsR family toxin [Cupriavidus necator]
MEKGTAHYKLAKVHELLDAGRMRMTRSAYAGATQMGLERRVVRDILLQLSPKDFYKSMTTYQDHRVWQDVYRPVTPYGSVYVKLTVTEGVLVVSFKIR